jgi:hypothetical protein
VPSLDVIGSIEITACAGILVGTLLLLHPGSLRSRTRLAVGFVTWFALLATLCAFEVFDPAKGLGTGAFAAAVALPMIVLLYLARRSPEWRGVLLGMPVAPLIGIHVIRILPGLDFLLLYNAARLPAPFALAAGWGDIAVGLLALPVALAFAGQLRGARALVLIWSILGIGDLVLALSLGALSAPDLPFRAFTDRTEMTDLVSLPWLLIPTYIVPILLCTHILILVLLMRGTRLIDNSLPGTARLGA